VLNPQDAEDISQEVMVKIITRIGQFQGRSSFRTWAYRVAVNTFLNWKKGSMEQQIGTFEEYGQALDKMPLNDISGGSTPDAELLVQEAKLSCMLGMLLCLDREQRLTFIIGDLFACPSDLGGVLFDITSATFRKRLERARSDLRNFMNSKCGLVNKENPCRCRRKTKAFIKAGWVDPKQLKFTRPTLRRLEEQASVTFPQFDQILEEDHVALYRQHPYYEEGDISAKFRALLSDRKVKRVFDL